MQTATPATGKGHAATAEEAVAIVKKARPRLRLGENQLAFLRQRLIADYNVLEGGLLPLGMIVLPEAMDLGWTHSSSRTAAEPIPHGEPCRRLAESAACHGIFLCAGLTERCADHDNQTDPYGAIWKDAYQPVAREFSVWIAGVSNVGPINDGPWAGRKCIGCSLVVGPDGAEVPQGPYDVDAETILYVDVKTVRRPARDCGWNKHWGNASTIGDIPSTIPSS